MQSSNSSVVHAKDNYWKAVTKSRCPGATGCGLQGAPVSSSWPSKPEWKYLALSQPATRFGYVREPAHTAGFDFSSQRLLRPIRVTMLAHGCGPGLEIVTLTTSWHAARGPSHTPPSNLKVTIHTGILHCFLSRPPGVSKAHAMALPAHSDATHSSEEIA